MEIETSYHHRMAQLAESFKAEGMREDSGSSFTDLSE